MIRRCDRLGWWLSAMEAHVGKEVPQTVGKILSKEERLLFIGREGEFSTRESLIETFLNCHDCGYVVSSLAPLKEAVLHAKFAQAAHNAHISLAQIL
jgi:hypothetical protein